MEIIAELLDKLKDARKTVELTDACGKRVCSSEEHWNCPYGNEGMTDCMERLEVAYEDTIENLLQLAEALISGRAEDQGLVNTPRPAWIPVEERLPEDRGDVLVVAYWHERWGVYMGWCAPERAEWSVHVGIGDRNDVSVTHWMPLPEPPEVGR